MPNKNLFIYKDGAYQRVVGGADSSVAQELLGTTTISADDEVKIQAVFTNIDTSKITARSILIFTYANCFVLCPLSQTGIGRCAGCLVYDDDGNAALSQVKFTLSGTTLTVNTNTNCDIALENRPTAYLFVLRF